MQEAIRPGLYASATTALSLADCGPTVTAVPYAATSDMMPPILFTHGWSQNHLCWARQYESALASEFRLVAYDLRGHGMSEAPLEPEHYTDGKLWAEDVAAIIEELQLDRPVLVGWSYGAFVICDYVRAYGQDTIAAIDFVEGTVKLGEKAFGTLIGPCFLDNFAGATADDLPTSIAAMRSFARACVVKPVPDDDLETAVCWNVVVPAAIRANLAARQIDLHIRSNRSHWLV
jgi:pimeloyl-ACP methyl ester carboxylesterase